MAQGKVEICGVNTAKLPVLDEKEKEELFARIKKGDEQAKEEYIKGNLRLVLSVIKRFGASNENPDDLFQIGCIGLIKAVNNFNTELDVKFSTYAVPMIIGEIRRYMRDNNSCLLYTSYSINTLYILAKYAVGKGESLPCLDSIKVSLKAPWALKVKVEEKPIVGYVENEDHYAYFDQEGMVVSESTALIEGLPCIEGISTVSYTHLFDTEKIKKSDTSQGVVRL